LAAIRQIEIVGLRLSLRRVFEEHYQAVFEHYKKAGYERKKRESGGGDITQAFGHVGPSQPNVTKATELLDFFADRLKVQQREAGVRHDLIDAVFALGGEDDLVRLLARVHALQAFVTTEDGANLLAGYKRAANILKKEGWDTQSRLPGLDPGSRSTSDADEEAGSRLGGRDVVDIGISYTPEPAERALIDALAAAAPRASEAVEAERFADAMAALATLRAPIDRFFEEVTVNDEEAEKRAARLALLARFRDAVHRVADFSRIEG
jgi:glycyl-tRNA synthetase beta chain